MNSEFKVLCLFFLLLCAWLCPRGLWFLRTSGG